jgi:hypothetical protein
MIQDNSADRPILFGISLSAIMTDSDRNIPNQNCQNNPQECTPKSFEIAS